MPKLALHWWILIGMAAGVGFGLLAAQLAEPLPPVPFDVQQELEPNARRSLESVWKEQHKPADPDGQVVPLPGLPLEGDAATDEALLLELRAAWDGWNAQRARTKLIPGYVDWIFYIGDLFLRLLRMIAVPLVLFSLVAGVASLRDTSRLARLGGKTIALYLGTTAIAIAIGLVVVNVLRPGAGLSPETKAALRDTLVTGENLAKAQGRMADADAVDIGQQLVNIVPQNPFAALAQTEMLQIVFFALFLGLALIRLPKERSQPVVAFFDTLGDTIIEMVHIIMKMAPLGVFALLAKVTASVGQDFAALGELAGEIGLYMLAVVLGLLLHMTLVYIPLLKFVAKQPVGRFFKALSPAQLLAFSSSSSGATLPVTIECCEKRIGVHEEASSFVLPLGATINMDGTGLYQGVAAVFIATMYNMDIGLVGQLQIVLTAALASIGTAAVPGVGLVMLVIVLRQVDVPPEGIALILAVDRPLDMCRTVLNVTGDATVCTTVAATEGLIEHRLDPTAPA